MATTHRDPTHGGNVAPQWLSLQEAARIYGVSVDTLRRRVIAGDLPASRLGQRLIRVRVDDLEHMFRPIPTVRGRWRRGA